MREHLNYVPLRCLPSNRFFGKFNMSTDKKKFWENLMIKELSQRIITSLVLISLLTLTFFYTYILIILLIIISVIAWIEFAVLSCEYYIVVEM